MKSKPIKIVLIYLICSVLWIVAGSSVTDVLSEKWSVASERIEIYKGIFFVVFTSILLYFTIYYQQKRVADSERQYKSFFFNNPTPMWIYDAESFKFVEVNNAAINAFGYKLNELKKMNAFDLAKDRDQARAVMLNMNNSLHHSTDWEVYKKDGETLVAHINAHRIMFDGEECVMVMAEDVTAAAQQEKTLQLLYANEKELKEELERNIKLMETSLEEQQRMAEILDRIHNMVIITDPFGIITWVNQAFIDTTGYSLEEVLGRFPDFLHGPDTDPHMQGEIMESIQKHSFSSFDIVNYTKSGEEYWVGITISAIYNDNQEIVRYISIETVITEQKLNEEKLKQQNEILKKLAWTNSHAVRKPVVSILGLVSLCKDSSDFAEIKSYQSLVESCARELDDITKEVNKEFNNGDDTSASA